MLFVFEENERNLIDCEDVNDSGIRRFTECPVASRLIRNSECGDLYENLDISNYRKMMIEPGIKNYIISSGVNHSPGDWCGFPAGNRKNLFDCLNQIYLDDLRSGNAMLLLDQSHEGYQTPWLWKWFHESCSERQIPISAVVYVTGNLLAEKQYDLWCDQYNVKEKMCVLPHVHFEHMIHETGVNRVRFDRGPNLPSFDDHVRYKTENFSKILDYNFLQKRLRNHRTWGYKAIFDSGLLDNGLLSMNQFDYMQTHLEGKFITEEETNIINKTLPSYVYGISNTLKGDHYYINRFNDDVMLDTWISVVSEASFSDTENTCFLSEKSFKPIACHHPFIIFGNKNSLEYLKDMGYRTFHPYIDESYDKLSTWDRLDGITNALKKFNAVEDKMEWYKSIEEILLHNNEVLVKNSRQNLPTSIVKLDQYYRKYFNVCEAIS